jgi:hypothetical protein
MSRENPLAEHLLTDAIATFRDYKRLADKALGQLTDEELSLVIDEESNSVGVIMKHLAGNMISRWTDFLTTDGEKPDRNRDGEFELERQMDSEALKAYWERGWAQLLATLESLEPADLLATVTIRGQDLTVVQAINRQLTHYAYHVGQVVFLAKHIRSHEWKTLSIPKKRTGSEPQQESGGSLRWVKTSR